MSIQKELQRQNELLELLLNLSNKITSNLDLRDAASGKFRLSALDFPENRGLLKEDLLITPTSTVRRALETLQPGLARSSS